MRYLKRSSIRHLFGQPARLLRDRRATVMVEMAACIPLFALVGLGGIELANLGLATTRISQIALNTADNASRMGASTTLSVPTVTEAEIQEVFIGAEKQANRLNFKPNGRIILSSLERNGDNGQTIKWQRCYGNLNVKSSYGFAGAGATGTSFPGMGKAGKEITAPPGSAIMFVEIVYQYQPLAVGRWLGPRTLRSTAAFNIRENRNLAAGVAASSGVTVVACPT